MIASPRNTSLSHPKVQAQPAPQADNQTVSQTPKEEPINRTTILVALIGALATIIAAFFASPLAEALSYDQLPALSETEVIVHIADEAGAAVDGAKVSLFFESGQFNKWTYSNGSVKFLVPLPEGADELDVSMTVEHDQYQIYNRQFEVPEEKLLEIRLNKKNKHSGKVIMRVVDDQSGLPVAGKNILLLVQGDIYNQVTDSNGIAEFVLPFPEGKIDAKISITPPDYEAEYQHVTLSPNKIQDLRLSSKEGAHTANLPNDYPVVATPTPVYVAVLTPEVAIVPAAPVPAAPVPAGPVPVGPVPAESVAVAPVPIAPAAASPTAVAPVAALDGLSTPVVEEAEAQPASIEANSTEEEPNTPLTSNRPTNIEPTKTEVVASSTPVPVITEESATNTPSATVTKEPATNTPSATVTKEPVTNTPSATVTKEPATSTATATKESATNTPTATNTKEVSTNTPTATVIEPSATQTPVPTATPVPPTETPTPIATPTPTPISVTITVTVVPTSEASEDQEQENDAEVNIVAEEATALPTEQVLVTIEATATALPAATATATAVTVETDESEVMVVAEEASEADEQSTGKEEALVEEEEAVVEEPDVIEAILVLDAYPAPEAYP